MKSPTTITATELQKHSGQILRRTHQDGEHFVVERAGYLVVAIIPVADYQKLMAMHPKTNKKAPSALRARHTTSTH